MIGGRGGRAKREIISRGDWILKEGNPGLPTVQKRFPAYIKNMNEFFDIFCEHVMNWNVRQENSKNSFSGLLFGGDFFT